MNSSDVAPGTNATATQYNNLRKDVRNSIKDPQSNTDGATVTFDLSAGAIHEVTLGGNRTLAVSNETVGQVFTLKINQDGTGGRTVTWFSTIRWINGVEPTLTSTASKRDVFVFIVTGSGTYDGFIAGQNI